MGLPTRAYRLRTVQSPSVFEFVFSPSETIDSFKEALVNQFEFPFDIVLVHQNSRGAQILNHSRTLESFEIGLEDIVTVWGVPDPNFPAPKRKQEIDADSDVDWALGELGLHQSGSEPASEEGVALQIGFDSDEGIGIVGGVRSASDGVEEDNGEEFHWVEGGLLLQSQAENLGHRVGK
jgi:hypothetical protein